ncbi:unnamed protein product [Rotaria sordida]|uniref:Uncharacterized protein n=1 Tax=Rotaria sordida TaxID=392033 RepID=A0A813N5A2_9BILA|nr:unnamed protein product [Rotaria sordida]CAF0760108.1 unnamed protein product [Rotaria sordida]CAF0802843.1 unnamed protein product [Rotaria sordida]CAF0873604.1 unnamed protein product [Rotaria sordida]CAF3508644.1 unnamed protein product [Rotaria sordida]
MREPMTLFEQSNVFHKINRQRLPFDQTVRHPPVYSSLNNVDDHDLELKTLSFDVYTSKHLVTTGKSILPYSGRHHLDEILLPAIEKDIHRDENQRRGKKKRPSYRKSLYHSTLSSSTQVDLTQLTARGTKPEIQTIIPIANDDDTIGNYQRHYAPPPSPSDDEIERLLYKLEAVNQSRSPSQQSIKEKEGYIPFRLPTLYRPAQSRRTWINSSPKDVRSTLSNYLGKYY